MEDFLKVNLKEYYNNILDIEKYEYNYDNSFTVIPNLVLETSAGEKNEILSDL